MRNAFSIALVALTIGCTHASAASRGVESALASVQNAQRAGAARDTEAVLELTRAESELAQAQALLEDGKARPARSAASAAQRDAEDALKIVRGRTSSEALQAAASLP